MDTSSLNGTLECALRVLQTLAAKREPFSSTVARWLQREGEEGESGISHTAMHAGSASLMAGAHP